MVPAGGIGGDAGGSTDAEDGEADGVNLGGWKDEQR